MSLLIISIVLVFSGTGPEGRRQEVCDFSVSQCWSSALSSRKTGWFLPWYCSVQSWRLP